MMNMMEDKIYKLHDAQMDMLKGLNVLTDKECPDLECIKAMGILSRAVKDLEEAIHMEHAMGHSEEEENGVKK